MELRRATVQDACALAQLRKQQLADEGLAATRDIDAELNDFFCRRLADDSYIAWLALEDGDIVATGGLCFYQLPPTFASPSGMVAYVTGMFTRKTHRRRGLASILLKKVLDEACSRGCGVIRLHASADGRNIYSKFGFTPSEGFMHLEASS